MSRNRSKDPPRSAADLMAELQKDPSYVAGIRQREQQQRKNVASYAQAAEPILKNLAAVGFRVATIRELRKKGVAYSSAVPVLLHWLPIVADPRVKEDIVRTLSVPWAKPGAAPALISEFRRADDVTGTGLRWAIANALSVVADDSHFDDLAGLVQNRRHGKAREMLALALANVRSPRAVELLIRLLDDAEVVGHAVVALGKLEAVEAQARLRDLTRHPTGWIREEARKSLASIEGTPLH